MGRTEDEVRALVASVQEHLKFKQLAVYSIDTFTKVLAPPNPKWREYINVAIDIHAASTVIKVIKQHPGNEAVLTATTKCLSRLAVDATNATIIGEEGGVDAVLASMAANDSLDQEVLMHSLALIDKMCNHAKSLYKIVTPKMIADVSRIMDQYQDDVQVVSVCARILEKMTRTCEGLETAAKAEAKKSVTTPLLAVSAAIATQKRVTDTDANAVFNVSKVLLRLISISPDVARRLRSLHAIDTFLDVLALYPDDDKLARQVAKLLAKIMDGNIADLLGKMQSGSLLPQQQERLLQLLSALAMDSDFADEIARHGGVGAVICAFESSISARAMEEIVRMIARLAASAKNLDDIIKTDAIASLAAALTLEATPPELKEQIVKTLGAISKQARTVAHVAQCPGAVDAIVAAVAESRSLHLARAGLEFLDQLARERDGAEVESCGLDVSRACGVLVAAMKAHSSDKNVQLFGSRALQALASTTPVVQLLVSDGAPAVVLKNLATFVKEADVVEASLDLISVLAQDSTGADALRKLGGFDVVVAAVCAHPEDADVRAAAVRFVGLLSNDALVAETVAGLQQADLCAFKGLERLPLLAMSLGVLAMVPENVPRLARNGAALLMVSVLQSLTSRGADADGHLVSTLCAALLEMPLDGIDSAAVVSACVAVVKQHKDVASAAPALQLLANVADSARDGAADACVRGGAVEACARACAQHAADARVLEPAMACLASLSQHSALAVGGKNGAKPCLALLVRTAGLEKGERDAFRAAALEALKVLERVAAASEDNAALVNQQGGVDAVFDALDTFSGCGDTVAQCERTLKALLIPAAAVQMLEKLKNRDLAKIKAGDVPTMQAASGDVSRLGLLGMCGGDFSAAVRDAGGPQLLAAVLLAAVACPQGSRQKAGLVRGCISALGRFAGRGLVVPGALALVPALVEELRQDASADVVRAVAALVGDSDVCAALVRFGCVEALMPLLEYDEFLEALFTCLDAFSTSKGGAMRIVQAGALPAVCLYVGDAVAETGGAAAIAEAVHLLANLVQHSDAETLNNAGILSVIDRILEQLGVSSVALKAPAAIQAVLDLMGALGGVHPEVALAMVQHSALKLMTLASTLCDVGTLQAAASLGVLAGLLEALAADEEAAKVLAAAGAAHVLMRAMTVFLDDVALAKKCAGALSRIAGGGAGVAVMVAQITVLAARCADGGDALPQSQRQLSKALRLVANLVLQPGLVDQPLADLCLDAVRCAIGSLNGVQTSTSQHDAVAATLALLSRLMNVAGISVPEDLTMYCLEGVLLREESSDQLQAAALAMLVSMVHRGGPAAVRAIGRHGLVAKVARAAHHRGVARSGPSKLQGEAAAAIQALLRQAVSHAAELAGDADGAHALAQLLAALVDQGALDDALRQVVAVEGGPQALLEALTHMDHANAFAGYEQPALAIIQALLKVRETVQAAVPLKIEHVSALTASRAHLGATDAIWLCGGAVKTLDGARLLFSGAEPRLRAFLISDLADANAPAAAAFIAQAAAHGDDETNRGLVSVGVPRALVGALKLAGPGASVDLVRSCLFTLDALADAVGASALQLSKEAIKVVTASLRLWPRADFQRTGELLLAKLVEAFAGGPEERLEDAMSGLAAFHAAAADWSQVSDGDGALYYSNSVRGESSWDEPLEYVAFCAELDAIVALVDSLGDVAGIDPRAAKTLVGCLSSHSNDAAVLGRCARILNALGRDASNLNFLASLEGIEALVGILEACPADDGALLDASELLLDVVVVSAAVRARLSLREYVRVLNQACLDHMASPAALIRRCLDILADLARGNAEVIGYCYEFHVPYTAKWAVQQHLNDFAVAAACVAVVTALLTDDEARKVYCCDEVTTEFVQLLQVYVHHPAFFAKILRCMGSMSIVDACILTMTLAGAVPKVVEGMDAHMGDAKLLRTAVELFSNFGALEDLELDEQTTSLLLSGGVVEAIKRVLRAHATAGASALLAACFDALYNIGNDEAAARAITEHGLCEMTLECLDSFDFHRPLLRQCVKLLSVLTYNAFSVDRLTSIGCADALLALLKVHADDEEFVVDCLLALSNLVTRPANASLFRDKRENLQIVYGLLDVYGDNTEVIKFVLITLVRLVADDDLSRATAEDGMMHLMRATRASLDDADVLALIFELVGQLAFVKSNIRPIVAAGGLQVLLDTLGAFDDDAALVVRAMATLDSLVSADSEYACVVVERNGEALLQACITKWSSDSAVAHEGRACLLSLRAMVAQKERGRTNRAALFDRLGDDMDSARLKTEQLTVKDQDAEPSEDPLRRYRADLKNGFALKYWSKGKATNRKLLFDPDFASLVLRDAGKADLSFPLSHLRAATVSHGDGHLVRSLLGAKPRATAKTELCVCLETAADPVCFEAKTADEATRLTDAVRAMLNVRDKWPHRLASG